MFGYHVHEKAILNVVVPFCLISFLQPKLFFLTVVTGTVSLFPLLFTNFEIVLKGLIAVFHATLCSTILTPSLRWFEVAYVIGFVPVYLFENLATSVLPNLPFLPLLVVSDYCLIGMLYSYIWLYWEFMNLTDLESDPTGTFEANRKAKLIVPSSSRVLRERKSK